jgi:hypothetical protein
MNRRNPSGLGAAATSLSQRVPCCFVQRPQQKSRCCPFRRIRVWKSLGNRFPEVENIADKNDVYPRRVMVHWRGRAEDLLKTGPRLDQRPSDGEMLLRHRPSRLGRWARMKLDFLRLLPIESQAVRTAPSWTLAAFFTCLSANSVAWNSATVPPGSPLAADGSLSITRGARDR